VALATICAAHPFLRTVIGSRVIDLARSIWRHRPADGEAAKQEFSIGAGSGKA
jgi:hypothetical protein